MYYLIKIATVLMIVMMILVGLAVTAAVLATVLHFIFGVQLPFAL